MGRFNLRKKPRISYYEPDDPNLDEYLFCDDCGDYVYEYCAIHGPLLVIPDDKVPEQTNFPSYVPHAALTIPHVFLHIAPSTIPGAGLGVFTTLTLPRGVRFGPYRGQVCKDVESTYCWQIYDANRRRKHVVDAVDPDRSNWMRYVNCSRHWAEQNLLAYQYQGELYYRTIRIIPRFTELMVFYGSEFANSLKVDLKKYNSPIGYLQLYEPPLPKIPKLDVQEQESESVEKTSVENVSSNEDPNMMKDKDMKTTVETSSTVIDSQIVPKTPKNDKNNKQETKFTKKSTISKVNDNNNNNLENLSCDICEYTCANVNVMTEHLRAHASTKCFLCDLCLFRTTVKSELISHIKLHECKAKSSSKESSNVKSHIRTHTGEKPYKCEQCSYSCKHLGNLKSHMRIHTGEKPFKCKQCSYSCTVLSSLKNHMRIHTGEKPYKCEQCSKSFTESGSLKKHMRIHTGEKPYKCEQCSHSFTRLDNLKDHMRIHTGEKPYKCVQCSYSFTQSSHLKTHLRIHTGEKPYKCEQCSHSFTRLEILKNHMRIHTGEKPYKCEQCSHSFTRLEILKNHMRIHTGEKPYKCEQCSYSFTMSSSLKNHMRIHTGEKPYKCVQCSYSCTRLGNLKLHIKRLH